MTLAIGILAIGILVHRDPVIADQARPDLGTIFNGNYHQEIDRFGTVSRTAYDASGRVIGVQVGTYAPGAPNGMAVELTYLQPDARHPQGQAFDGDGNPTPLH
jgi:YD repeat-containing protein